MGKSYYNEKNYKKAFEWYKKAAELGTSFNSMNNLGDCYYNGYGVKKNHKKAVEWYRKSADKGNSYAKDQLKELGIT